MAALVYNEGSYQLRNGGSVNFTSDTIKARPFLTSATENQDATSMTSQGVTGYDVTLGSKTITKDDSNNRVVYDAADFSFLSVPLGTGEIDSYIVFKFGTNDADSIPLFHVTLSTPRTPNGGNLDITVNAAGLAYLQG